MGRIDRCGRPTQRSFDRAARAARPRVRWSRHARAGRDAARDCCASRRATAARGQRRARRSALLPPGAADALRPGSRRRSIGRRSRSHELIERSRAGWRPPGLGSGCAARRRRESHDSRHLGNELLDHAARNCTAISYAKTRSEVIHVPIESMRARRAQAERRSPQETPARERWACHIRELSADCSSSTRGRRRQGRLPSW